MDVNQIGMIILTIIHILSFAFATYIYFQLAQRTSPLRRFQNRLLIYLLVQATWTIMIDLPSTQTYLWTGWTVIHTPWFCITWNISFFSASTINRILAALMCIERHFLVFRPQTYHTYRRRLIYHYIPVILIILLVLIYMCITNIFLTCSNLSFNYSSFMCGYTCAIIIINFGAIYVWVWVFIPTMLTIVACVLLPIRFVIQKRTLRQTQWYRARKLIIQTSIIVSAYTICWIPYSTILQLLLNRLLPFTNPNINRILAIIPYMTSLLTPFVIYHTIRNPLDVGIIKQLKRFIFPHRQVAVQPVGTSALQHRNVLSVA